MPSEMEIVSELSGTIDYIRRTRSENNQYFEQTKQDIEFNYVYLSWQWSKSYFEWNDKYNTLISQLISRQDHLASIRTSCLAEQHHQLAPHVTNVEYQLMQLTEELTMQMQEIVGTVIDQATDNTKQEQQKYKINLRKIDLLIPLNASLHRLQYQFPVLLDDASPSAQMGALVHGLWSEVHGYLRTLSTTHFSDEDAVKAYTGFKKEIDRHLNQDEHTRDLKNKDSILYPVHYALIALFRAFFRVFDIIITLVLQAEHTMADTPNRNAFFKYPEKPLGRHVAALYEEFTVAIDELDTLGETELRLIPAAL